MVSKDQSEHPLDEALRKGEQSSPFFDYLQSAQGHELSARIVTVIEEINKRTLERSAEQAKLGIELRRHSLMLQGVVFVVTVVAASFLTYSDKFNSTLGVLFGTLVGYFFGRKAS